MKYENLQQAHYLVDGLNQADRDLVKPFLPALPEQKTLDEILEDVYEAYMCAEDEPNSNRLDEIHFQLVNLSKPPQAREIAFSWEDYEELPEGSVVLGLGEPRIKNRGKWRFGLYDCLSDGDMAGKTREIIQKGQALDK